MLRFQRCPRVVPGFGVVLAFVLAAPVPAGPAAARQDAAPTCASDDHRRFDFWVGEWEVFTPDGNRAGGNHIQLVLGGCALHESWTSAGGGHGNSYTFYDSARGVWHQTWIDARGQALYIDGNWDGEAMVLSDGSNRITWSQLDGGRVRQHWQVSSDDGATWSTAFDGEYRPVSTRHD